MGDMGPRGAINMGGRDLKQKPSVPCNSLGNCTCCLWYLHISRKLKFGTSACNGEISYIKLKKYKYIKTNTLRKNFVSLKAKRYIMF